MVDQSESQATSAALFQGKIDPDLEECVDEGLLVFAEVDGSQSDALDDSFDRGAISLGSGKEHVGRSVREDRIGHVLASERVEGTGVAHAGGKCGPAVGDGCPI